MFDDVGICLTYSSDKNVELWERAQTDADILQLLKDRWAYRMSLEKTCHTLESSKAEVRRLTAQLQQVPQQVQQQVEGPLPGDFASLPMGEHEKKILTDAYAAVSTTPGGWDFLKTFVPASTEGFMFSRHPILTSISQNMSYDGHSGASYGWVMRNMEAIAKEGWDAYIRGLY